MDSLSNFVINADKVLTNHVQATIYSILLPFNAFKVLANHTKLVTPIRFVQHNDYIANEITYKVKIKRPVVHESIISRQIYSVVKEYFDTYKNLSFLIQIVNIFDVKSSTFMVQPREFFTSSETITIVGREFKTQVGSSIFTISEEIKYLDGKEIDRYTKVLTFRNDGFKRFIDIYYELSTEIPDNLIDETLCAIESVQTSNKCNIEPCWAEKAFWNDQFNSLNLITPHHPIAYGLQHFNNVTNIKDYATNVMIEFEFTVKFKGDSVYNFIKSRSIQVFSDAEYFRFVDKVGKIKYRNDIIFTKTGPIVSLPNGKIVCHETKNNMVSYKECLEADFNTRRIELKDKLSQFPSKKTFLKHSIVSKYSIDLIDGMNPLPFSVTLCKKINDNGTEYTTNLEYEFDDSPEINAERFKIALVRLFNGEGILTNHAPVDHKI